MTPQQGAQQTLLSASDLYCERDDRVLFEGLALSITDGELIQLAGPNGAGKTTLLRLLAGLNRDFEGQLLWHDVPLMTVYPEYAGNRLYMGHLSAVKKSLTAIENLRWLTAQDRPSEKQLWEALEHVALAGYEHTPCLQLSAGQQRRVALARLKISRAPLWILDEPFTALDKDGVSWLEGELQAHVSNGGAVIITSHHALEGIPGLRRLELGGVV